MKKFCEYEVGNENNATAADRMERAYWLMCAVETIADTLANNQDPIYNAEEMGEIIKAVVWHATLELAAVQEAAAMAVIA